jgi:hypothetical protein
MEDFYVRPDGKYFAIYWGPILVCTNWSTKEGADNHCALLEALRVGRGIFEAWEQFSIYTRGDRSLPETAQAGSVLARLK